MYFIKKNLSDFVVTNRDIFIIFILVQILSTFSCFFLYGLVHNYQLENDDMSYDTFKLSYYTEEVPVTKSNLRKIVNPMLEKSASKLEGFSILLGVDEYMIQSYNGYASNHCAYPNYGDKTVIKEGRDITEEEFINGAHIALGDRNFTVGQIVKLGGVEYEVVGIFQDFPNGAIELQIPYNSIDFDGDLLSVTYRYLKHPTESDYRLYESLINEYFGDMAYYDQLYINKASRKKVARSIDLIAVFIALLSSINIFIIYKYVLQKRRKRNAVIQICGLPYRKMYIHLFVELAVITSVQTVCGSILFWGINKWIFQFTFTYFEEIFSMSTYGKVWGIYFVSLLIMSMIITPILNNREILSLLRRSYEN